MKQADNDRTAALVRHMMDDEVGLSLIDSIEDAPGPLCEECMTDHCESSNCLGCEYVKYLDCRFYGDKKHRQGKEKQE